jgi:hypothetical protein
MATPRNTRNAVTRQSATTSTSKTTTTTPAKDSAKTLDVEIVSIDEQTSFYKRKDGSEMERQTGIGYCASIKSEVIITRSLTDKDGNEKIMMSDDNIGQSYSALVNKVALKGGGFAFYAEISLSRIQKASDDSLNLFDTL